MKTDILVDVLRGDMMDVYCCCWRSNTHIHSLSLHHLCSTTNGTSNMTERNILFFLNPTINVDSFRTLMKRWVFKTNLKTSKCFNKLAIVYDNSFKYDDRLQRRGQWHTKMDLINLIAIGMLKYMRVINTMDMDNIFIGKKANYNLKNSY